MSNLKIAGAVIVGGLWLAGCATTDYVDKHVATVQDQVTGVQGQVSGVQGQVKEHDARLSAQDARLGALDQNTKEALDRADKAGVLAQGKFVYSMVLTDEATKFPADSSKLSDEANARLTEFATKLKTDNRNVYLEIQGYTDATGSPQGNYRLGQERAEAVRRYLNQQGVALNRMSTISYGQENPVASNKKRAGRAENRRVVVVVLE